MDAEEQNQGIVVQITQSFKNPSKINEADFEKAIEEIANISGILLSTLQTASPPKNREEEAEMFVCEKLVRVFC